MSDVVVFVAYVGLLAAAGCAAVRLVRGPTMVDRMMALDLMLIVLMTSIAVDAANRGDTTWLNPLVVIAVVGFTATVAVAGFIERDASSADVPADVDADRGSSS